MHEPSGAAEADEHIWKGWVCAGTLLFHLLRWVASMAALTNQDLSLADATKNTPQYHMRTKTRG